MFNTTGINAGVIVKHEEILSSRCTGAEIGPCRKPEILLTLYGPNLGEMLPNIFSTTIGRAVVNENYFKVRVCLNEKGREAFVEKPHAIKVHDNNTDDSLHPLALNNPDHRSPILK
jgi:hypothetical protein